MPERDPEGSLMKTVQNDEDGSSGDRFDLDTAPAASTIPSDFVGGLGC